MGAKEEKEKTRWENCAMAYLVFLPLLQLYLPV